MKNITEYQFLLSISTAIMLSLFFSGCTDNKQNEPDLRERFVKVAATKWGTNNIALPSSCVWVEYGSNLNNRFVVCFKSGNIKLQMLIGEHTDPYAASVTEQLRKNIFYLATDTGKDSLQQFIRKTSSSPAGKSAKQVPVLANQLRLKNGTLVTPDTAAKFADEIVSCRNRQVKPVSGTDGVTRKELTITFHLVKDHLQRRADMYRPIVNEYADKYKLNEAMLMALIHTESSFNPRARSATPAFGLMQIVPESGGRDATKFLFGRAENLSPSYLYKPDKNIEIGTAYLHILNTRYWGAVKNRRSREYCILASYNGGAGNVARLFAGIKSRKKAIRIINRMSPDAVYIKLTNNHKLRETRNYLQRIMKRTALYSGK